MAELNDIYGSNYQQESLLSKNNYVINTIANNIAHRQLSFRLFDTSDLWDISHKLPLHVINSIQQKINIINKNIRLYNIDKKSVRIKMFPYLVIDTPVEYFWIIDLEYQKSYFMYMTPREVAVY